MSNFLGFSILQKCSRNLFLRDRLVCPTYCIPQLISVSFITLIRSDEVQSVLLIMENCLPFTEDVMVVLVHKCVPGRVAQSVTCLATDACLTAILGVASWILARSHTFVEIDHEIISTVILPLPLNDSFKKGCCQLHAKVCARITGYPLVQACPGKSVVR